MFIIILSVYYLIGTIVIMNLVFNPRIKLEMVDKKTGKTREPTPSDYIFFGVFWFFVPYCIEKGKEND